jgi:tRNA-splicing ligase RtcB (3'-phosphate/5'-hydroxy nucleic acid ligase)
MKKTKIYTNCIEDEALKQFEEAMSLECNVQGALMPDTHTGYTLPIGAVIKSKDIVFPSYVGYDIGCGMCAVNLDITKDSLNLEDIKYDILNNIPLGSDKHKLPQKINIDENMYCLNDFTKDRIKDTGMYQIGTLGGGNHFIEIGESENDKTLWIVIHSGSRGLGYKVADYFMTIATQGSVNIEELKKEFIIGREIFKEKNPDGYKKAFKKFVESKWSKATKNKEGHFGFDINSELGQSYLHCMNYCLDFALENRKTMIHKILDSISLQKQFKVNTFINRNHNHAEIKDGYVIHRKGATHAEKDMLGVIPANMKDGSFIIKGKGNIESMCSSSHGSGRVLSRKQAKEILDLKEFHNTMIGVVTNHTDETLDESPKAYKDIFEVMELQKDLVDIIDRSIPILNIKG